MPLFLKTKDYSVTGEEFELHQHEDADMLVTLPKPQKLEIYYQSESYISHTDSKKTVFDKLYQYAKEYNLMTKLRLIEKHQFPGTYLLDYGAGTGDFVRAAQQKGYKVEGFEPNQLARAKAASKGVVLKATTKGVENKTFDVVTLWHVLEHIPNLEQELAKIKGWMKKDALLVIAVPNYKSYDAQYYKKYWAAYDVPRHLWHFSRKGFHDYFEKNGMKVLGEAPLRLDAYYVSLLSEKFQKNMLPWLAGLYRGFLSNRKAARTGEYSSVVYFIKSV